MVSNQCAIKIKNVNFTYAIRPEDGLRDINLSVRRGECVLLTGASGCGKTSLTRIVNGLIPNFYEGELSGDINIDGQSIASWKLEELSMKVGSVFQNPRSQFFNLDTTNEIAFGCENLGISREQILHRVNKTVADLQIERLLNRNIFSLSGGEKQMLAIASAYALGPDIFVLDEPSANLDAFATNQLREVLEKLKQEGKTILIAEHRLYYLADIADRILYMEKGRIVEEWSAKEFSKVTKEQRIELGLRAWDLSQVQIELFSDSVIGEVELSLKSGKNEKSDDAFEILSFLSLNEFAEQHPMSLSGGQKQRLAIAAGIAQSADVLILDEPTSGLDYILGGILAEIISATGKYINFLRNAIGFVVVTVITWLGFMFNMIFQKQYYMEYATGRGSSAAYVEKLLNLANGSMFYAALIVTVICAFLGALLGRKLLKKHFEKAGMI